MEKFKTQKSVPKALKGVSTTQRKNDSILQKSSLGRTGASATARLSTSTGTLQTIKTLKDKLSKINDMSRDLTDAQLKELLNLGDLIQNKVSRESSTNSFTRARSNVFASHSGDVAHEK